MSDRCTATMLQPHNLMNIFLLLGKTLVSVVTKLSDPLKISCLMYAKEPLLFSFIFIRIIHILINSILVSIYYTLDTSEETTVNRTFIPAFRVLSAL